MSKSTQAGCKIDQISIAMASRIGIADYTSVLAWVYDRPPLMLTRTYLHRHLLRHLQGTEPFVVYCERRGIPIDQTSGKTSNRVDDRQWQAALHQLDEAARAQVELELAQVNELANSASISLLAEDLRGVDLPPDSIPGDAARALWFLLHYPAVFHEVLLGQEIAEIGAWRVAQAPPLRKAEDLLGRHAALAESLRDFFRIRDGTGKYCAVDAFLLGSSPCFVAYLSDRLHLLDVFTEDGRHATRPQRLAVPLIFIYEPDTGRIRLRTRLRSGDKLLEVIRRFAQTVLDTSLPDDCLRPAYRLDLLKQRFDFPADAADVELARVKSLHLGYPERSGRRRVKLETLSGDDRHAIFELLREHGGMERTADDLAVLYAELEVRLRIEGRSKPYVIRLWPDRTSLSRTALGKRFHVCLRRWGIADAD